MGTKLATKPFILAISTSTGVAEVCAVSEGGENTLLGQSFSTVFQFEIRDYKAQSARLLPELGAAMSTAKVTGADCIGIAVNIGPGGFTSLRTACGLAQGLAVGWGVSCLPLTSFEAMAAQALLDNLDLTERSIASLLDARLNEIYAARLKLSRDSTEWLQPPCLVPMQSESAQAFLQADDVALLDPAVFELLHPETEPAPEVSAWSLGLAALGLLRFKAGKTGSVMDCQPLYVREKVAQTTAERRKERHGSV